MKNYRSLFILLLIIVITMVLAVLRFPGHVGQYKNPKPTGNTFIAGPHEGGEI